MGDARERTLALVAHLDDEELSSVPSPIMSPLAWDLAHIAAYEDLWISHRWAGRPLLRAELAELYDAFETPRAIRGEIDALSPGQARRYMAEVRERTGEVLLGAAAPPPGEPPPGEQGPTRAGAQAAGEWGAEAELLCEMVLRHELQHTETMRQTMALAGQLDGEDLARLQAPLRPPGAGDPEWLELPGGTFAMGAAPEGFAYDNERARHEVELHAFAMARRPATNGEWRRFIDDGGYERDEWWSPEGWEWLRGQETGPHPGIVGGDPDAPACHVCWFEAEAYARARGARLPTEAEWERAAGEPPGHRGGLEGLGRVWEWTASHFRGYPGFVAHPYPQYSQVFFGEGYRVLRGGSWATSARVATLTFRNWDLPVRGQIFAGVRLARDL